ncbi:TIR domain-containing protein [Parasphingopyxis marina]|uniref:TIR domain-containing protein n=1 Tax=Parasphingopyxis marina TaxID=2761622 RepID=A0A842HVL0_9SPHN|nr:TIR domain-containing protein [Parasphingopyxis marina]MBC2776467.1 TIR domain-containing protein [Parasphingopyxis marina]
MAFISHHSSQEKTARHLKNVLERNGVTGWMAPDDIEPGVAFDQAIIEQVERSDLILLLFCSKSDQSRHVKRELMMAENNKKLIYPVRLEDIDAKGLAYWLNDYQWVDWIDRRDATIQKMIDTIKRQVGTAEAAASPPPEEPAAENPEPAEPAPEAAPGKTAAAPPKSETAKAEDSKAASKADKAPPPKAEAPKPPPPPPPPPAAAKPGPGDAAPLGLAGSAPDGGNGAAGLSRATWIVIGAVAVFLAIVLGLLVNALVGGSESEFKVRPGQWATSYEFERTLENSRLNASETQAFIRQIDEAAVAQCIYEDDARSPGDDFFDPDGSGNCEMSNLEMTGGEFSAQLQCRPDWLNGEPMRVWLRGTYDWEEINAEAEYAIAPGTNREFRFVTTETKRHIGPCD